MELLPKCIAGVNISLPHILRIYGSTSLAIVTSSLNFIALWFPDKNTRHARNSSKHAASTDHKAIVLEVAFQFFLVQWWIRKYLHSTTKLSNVSSFSMQKYAVYWPEGGAENVSWLARVMAAACIMRHVERTELLQTFRHEWVECKR